MLRTVAAHCATLQAHLNKYQTQAIIDNQTMADTGSRGTVRAAFSCVERERRRRLESA
jgi:RecA/RadA recombinase